MSDRLNYAGAVLLIVTGISLYSRDPSLPIVGASPPALQLIVAGLVWVGLALNIPLRERGYRGTSAGLPRTGPARGAGQRSHRVSRRVAARPFAGRGVALNASTAVAGGSFLKDSVRTGVRDARRNLTGVGGSVWAVLSAVVLNLTTSRLLLADRDLSPLGHSEAFYAVASLAVFLGLIVAGVFAADPASNERERATPEGMPPAPTRRGALLLGKVWGVMAVWLLIFAVSVPHILVAGYGTGVPWTGLAHAFVLGTLCVAGFATLTAGISVLSGSGRGVALASMTILAVMSAPALTGVAPQKSWLGNAYNALSPVARARLSLENVIVDKETLLVQLPHVGALAAFVVVAGVFAAFAARGVSPEGVGWHRGREDFRRRDSLGPRPRANDPVRVVRSPKRG